MQEFKIAKKNWNLKRCIEFENLINNHGYQNGNQVFKTNFNIFLYLLPVLTFFLRISIVLIKTGFFISLKCFLEMIRSFFHHLFVNKRNSWNKRGVFDKLIAGKLLMLIPFYSNVSFIYLTTIEPFTSTGGFVLCKNIFFASIWLSGFDTLRVFMPLRYKL